MPKSCIVRHPRDGQKVRAIHARPGGKPSFLHFVASGELAKAEEVGAVLKGPDGKETKGTTKTKPTETFWIIAFHIEAPDPAAVYDLEIRDGSGATLAVCKKLQFLESHNSLTIDVPSGEDVCPTFTCSGTSTTTSPIQASACKVGGTAANVTIVQNPNGDGEWIVKFNNCAITDPNPTTVAVGQVDGSTASVGTIIIGCSGPPGP